ncbi:thioesterase family protein [Thermus filiformis]|jgi:predicted thioesterase|uniref:Thioesterase n=1 Tax=Thermus filiformis TaxID=276 RepID=A0A0A2WQ49_THEFI|nr:thioesterase family protein [Thermus filiformis]KGQ21948.1 thioesterase [Thermus filiformis]
MKPIPPGYQAVFETVVTPEMTVDFEELGPVHPVYATYWMVKHMELAGRKIILPFLEEGEEGIGSYVEARHLAPALVGMRVRVVAVHERTEGNRVHARVEVYNELGDLIGTGRTEQVILPRSRLEALFGRLEARWKGV